MGVVIGIVLQLFITHGVYSQYCCSGDCCITYPLLCCVPQPSGYIQPPIQQIQPSTEVVTLKMTCKKIDDFFCPVIGDDEGDVEMCKKKFCPNNIHNLEGWKECCELNRKTRQVGYLHYDDDVEEEEIPTEIPTERQTENPQIYVIEKILKNHTKKFEDIIREENERQERLERERSRLETLRITHDKLQESLNAKRKKLEEEQRLHKKIIDDAIRAHNKRIEDSLKAHERQLKKNNEAHRKRLEEEERKAKEQLQREREAAFEEDRIKKLEEEKLKQIDEKDKSEVYYFKTFQNSTTFMEMCNVGSHTYMSTYGSYEEIGNSSSIYKQISSVSVDLSSTNQTFCLGVHPNDGKHGEVFLHVKTMGVVYHLIAKFLYNTPVEYDFSCLHMGDSSWPSSTATAKCMNFQQGRSELSVFEPNRNPKRDFCEILHDNVFSHSVLWTRTQGLPKKFASVSSMSWVPHVKLSLTLVANEQIQMYSSILINARGEMYPFGEFNLNMFLEDTEMVTSQFNYLVHEQEGYYFSPAREIDNLGLDFQELGAIQCDESNTCNFKEDIFKKQDDSICHFPSLERKKRFIPFKEDSFSYYRDGKDIFAASSTHLPIKLTVQSPHIEVPLVVKQHECGLMSAVEIDGHLSDPKHGSIKATMKFAGLGKKKGRCTCQNGMNWIFDTSRSQDAFVVYDYKFTETCTCNCNHRRNIKIVVISKVVNDDRFDVKESNFNVLGGKVSPQIWLYAKGYVDPCLLVIQLILLCIIVYTSKTLKSVIFIVIAWLFILGGWFVERRLFYWLCFSVGILDIVLLFSIYGWNLKRKKLRKTKNKTGELLALKDIELMER